MRTLPEIGSLRNALEDCRALLWSLNCIRGMQKQRESLLKLEALLDQEINAALVAQADELTAADGGRFL
jgi:hypothetical protein